MNATTIIAALLSLLRAAVKFLERRQAMKQGRDNAELDARRQADTIERRLRNADAGSVSDDDIIRG